MITQPATRTDFTLQASVVVLASFAGVALGGRVADGLIAATGSLATGYAAHFAVGAALTVVGAVLMGSADHERAR